MKNNKSLILSCVLALSAPIVLTSCSSKNMALEDARQQLSVLKSDQDIQQYAPVELHEAEKTLMTAKKSDDRTHTRNIVEIAKNKMEIAKVAAQRRKGEATIDQLHEQKDKVILNQRTQELESTKQSLDGEKRRAEMASALAEQANREADQARQKAKLLEDKNSSLVEELGFMKAKETQRGIEFALEGVMFEFGKADLKEGAKNTLKKVADVIKDSDTHRNMLIEGFTDSIGSNSYNQQLSEQRAASVKAYLVSQGVNPGKLDAVGLGEEKPKATNNTEAGRQLNRRVEVTILNK